LLALCQGGELVSPVIPSGLAAGQWWSRASGGPPWPNRLRAGIIEPRRGYRFRPENLALAALLGGRSARRIVDLGAGTGSLLLIACAFLQPERAIGLDRQPDMAERLARTLSAHGESAWSALAGDVREAATIDAVITQLGGPADLVVMNPPYFDAAWGRPSREASTRLSTHAEHGDVGDFLAAARRLLAGRGIALVVYDAPHLSQMLAAAGEAGMRLTRLVWIPDHRHGHRPFRVWAELGVGTDAGAAIDALVEAQASAGEDSKDAE
jgi:tRNA1(Val) A37 N6-methylase TrmN6